MTGPRRPAPSLTSDLIWTYEANMFASKHTRSTLTRTHWEVVIWPLAQLRRNSSCFHALQLDPTYHITHAFVSFSAGVEVSLHVTSWKYQRWASLLTKLTGAKAVCVQLLWPAGCTGKQKIALSSRLTLTRMPFNQWAHRSKGPIIALIDWIFLSDHRQRMDDFLPPDKLKEEFIQ